MEEEELWREKRVGALEWGIRIEMKSGLGNGADGVLIRI